VSGGDGTGKEGGERGRGCGILRVLYTVSMLPTLPLIFAFFFFLLGACVGSFLNVVVLRYNTGMGLNGRSRCFSCARTIRWYENIPILSFGILRGRCRGCASRISWQYPLVELLTAVLFCGTWLFVHSRINDELWSFDALALAIYYCILFSILIIILIYDIKHKIIPNVFVYSFALVSLGGLVALSSPHFITDAFLWDLAAGPMFFFPFFLLWFFSGGRWIGLGDGKLALGIGWMLGLVHGLSAIILAFWIGAVVSVILLGTAKLRAAYPNVSALLFLPAVTMKTEVPFAPFLILGIVVSFFWRVDLVGLSFWF